MNKKRSGFTLIELLVVISIIALLMSIMMPALQNVREQAKCTICQTNQKNLSLAWFMYQSENNGRLVGAHTWLSNGEGDEDFAYCWVERPQKEDGTRADYSPTEEQEINGLKKGLLYTYLGDDPEIFHCPSDRRIKTTTGYRSYSIPGCMNGPYDGGGYKTAGLKRYTQIKRPSESYMMVEEMFTGDRGWNIHAWQMFPDGDTWGDPISIVHNGRSTLGFADGHGEKHKWKDERTIKWAEGDDSDDIRTQPDNEDLKYMQDGWAE